jgi:hypothetical protein
MKHQEKVEINLEKFFEMLGFLKDKQLNLQNRCIRSLTQHLFLEKTPKVNI